MDFGSDYMQLPPGEYLDVYFQAQPGSVFILGLPSASLGAINPPSVRWTGRGPDLVTTRRDARGAKRLRLRADEIEIDKPRGAFRFPASGWIQPTSNYLLITDLAESGRLAKRGRSLPHYSM